MGKSDFDIWLDRGVKAIGIIGFLGASYMAINGMFYLPNRLEAAESEIQRVKNWEAETDTRLAVIEQDVKYLVKGIDEIKRTIGRSR